MIYTQILNKKQEILVAQSEEVKQEFKQQFKQLKHDYESLQKEYNESLQNAHSVHMLNGELEKLKTYYNIYIIPQSLKIKNWKRN